MTRPRDGGNLIFISYIHFLQMKTSKKKGGILVTLLEAPEMGDGYASIVACTPEVDFCGPGI